LSLAAYFEVPSLQDRSDLLDRTEQTCLTAALLVPHLRPHSDDTVERIRSGCDRSAPAPELQGAQTAPAARALVAGIPTPNVARGGWSIGKVQKAKHGLRMRACGRLNGPNTVKVNIRHTCKKQAIPAPSWPQPHRPLRMLGRRGLRDF